MTYPARRPSAARRFTPSVSRAIVAIALAVVVSACSPMVSVKTGTIVECRYGHVVSDSSRTVRVQASKAASYRVTTQFVICPDHRAAEQLLADALAALAKGDKAGAELLTKQAYERAPDVKDPDRLADRLGVKKPRPKPTPSRTPTGAPSGPSGGGVVSPVDLMRSLPRSLPGYSFLNENRSEVAATRTFIGVKALPRTVVMQVTYVGAPEAYQAWFDQSIKSRYSTSSQYVSVGRRKVYFGTDGTRFATVAWRSGGAAFQVEASVTSGSPARLKSALIAVVRRMP